MKQFFLFLCGIFVSVVCFAETVTLDWYKDGQLYDQTTCNVGESVSLPTPPTKFGYDFDGWSEIFDRGTFANWAAIPNVASGYLYDSNGSNIPQENDYIIINDASGVPEYGENIEIQLLAVGRTNLEYCRTYINEIDYGCDPGSIFNENITIYRNTYNGSTQLNWKSDTKDICYAGTKYTKENTFLSIRFASFIEEPAIRKAKFINSYPYSGKWLLRYHGDWNDYGRGGWIPEKQLD